VEVYRSRFRPPLQPLVFDTSNSVNTFYHVGREPIDENSPNATQEREFKIGSIGFGDSIGILLASLLSVPMEIWLCDVQVGRGRNMCRQL
jgi:battenin